MANTTRLCVSAEGERPNLSKGFSEHSVVLLVPSTTKCVTGCSSRDECQVEVEGKLRMPGCVRIADSDEHTAESALVKFHTTFLPVLSEGPLGVG